MEPLIELNHKERGKREGRKQTCVWRSGGAQPPPPECHPTEASGSRLLLVFG